MGAAPGGGDAGTEEGSPRPGTSCTAADAQWWQQPGPAPFGSKSVVAPGASIPSCRACWGPKNSGGTWPPSLCAAPARPGSFRTQQRGGSKRWQFCLSYKKP